MSVTRMRFPKTETRDFADRHRLAASRFGRSGAEWNVSDRSFFTAFVVIAALLATAALVLR